MRALLSVYGVYLSFVSKHPSNLDSGSRVAVRKIANAGIVTPDAKSLKYTKFKVTSVIFAIFMRFSHICAKMRVC